MHARETRKHVWSAISVGLLLGLVSLGRAGSGAETPGGAFDESLSLYGIRFHVSCPNEGSESTLTVVPTGLEIDNSPVTREVEGIVVGAEIADLDLDQSPEIYVYVQSAGSGSYGSLVALSANGRKSLSDIYLPPITDDPEASRGYMGHDELAVVETRLVRRFPVYREGDSNANPTGGTRQIQYELARGEAGWVLKIDKIVEF